MNEQQSNEDIVALKQQIEELKQKNVELQSNVSKGLEENKDKNEHSIKKILIIMGSLTIILLGLLVVSLVTKNIREDAWCSHPEIYDLLDKPAIYVYGNKDSNEQIQNYTVSLTTNNENNKIKTIYPNATIDGNTYSWNISVDKNKSGLVYDNQNYDYLFWDAESNIDFEFNNGFCIKGSNTKDFLEEKLYSMGLNEKEVHDFVVYWLPIMQNNDYNLISFVGMDKNDTYNKDFDLQLLDDGIPVGDSFRVIMVWKSVDEKIDIEEQTLPHFNRPTNKPYMIEWGGCEITH